MKLDNELTTFIEKEKKREPYKIFEFIDKDEDLKAFIVIDSLKNSKSYGGLRIAEFISLEEIKSLAKSMSLKYCFLKRTMGGAKCGILIPESYSHIEKNRILKSFGKKASIILKDKTYSPWTDLNSSPDDIYTILKAAGCKLYEISNSSYFTALTIVSSIKAACRYLEINMSKVSVIVEGFGNVGNNVAKELAVFGVKIIGLSTVKGSIYNIKGYDIDKLSNLRIKFGDSFINNYKEDIVEPKELLLEMNSDILIPCARPWSINKNNMNNIRSKIIVPGANNPFRDNADEFLNKKNILCLPDFVSNIGGILGSSLFDNGISEKRIYRFIMNDFSRLIMEILVCSNENNITPYNLAEIISYYNCYLSANTIKRGQIREETSNSALFIKKLYSLIPLRLKNELFLLNEKRKLIGNLKTIKKLC